MCGNWGLLLLAAEAGGGRGLLPREVQEFLENVLQIVELRGAQAGGFCTFVERGRATRAVVVKAIKSKRGHLAEAVFGQAARQLFRQRLCGAQRPEVMLFQGHSRFGTSSAPAVRETHPHQWEGTVVERVWAPSEASPALWVAKTVPYCVTLTHNGDFDAWFPYGDFMGVGKLGWWLGRVLSRENTARGDSAKLSGVLDLLVTKGSWFRSVRCAYVLHEMTSCKQEVPPESALRAWAAVFDAAFAATMAELDDLTQAEGAFGAGCGLDVSLFISRVAQELADLPPPKKQWLQHTPSHQQPKSWHSFAARAVDAFLYQDAYAAVKRFFEHAEGTFAISVSCTTSPGTCVLAARGQPLSLGLDASRGLAYWSSEPASIAASWPSSPDGRPAAELRLQLNDAKGEVVEVRVLPRGVGPSDTAAAADGLEPLLAVPLHAKGSLQADARPRLVLRGCSLDGAHQGLSRARLEERLEDMRAQDSPLSGLPSSRKRGWAACSWLPSLGCGGARADPIAHDLKQIPAVLQQIDLAWRDGQSPNRVAAQDFAELVARAASAAPVVVRGGVREIDVLVLGVESSLWLGEQFAADLSRAFPSLYAVALSANHVLGLLQSGAGFLEPTSGPFNGQTLRLSPGAVCLAISQSGTTYPTVWATRLLRARLGCPVFGMSGHLDTLLKGSLGVDGKLRTFSTLAGIRPSEASTVATVAMHHTLSHLLLECFNHAAQSGYVQPTSAPKLTGIVVSDLQRILEGFLPATEALCATTRDGKEMPSDVHDDLVKTGGFWGQHITEGYWGTIIGAIYVYATVTFGVAPVWTAVTLLGVENHVPHWVPHLVDAHIYVFVFFIICLMHRLMTGRRLWTRFCARSLLIVDCSTTNCHLLAAYVTKLRALAWRLSTFGVSWQNGMDSFVHEATHLTTSDTLVAMGFPDCNLLSLASNAAAMVMALQQAKFVKGGTTGIEAVSLGHNPCFDKRLVSCHVALPADSRPAFWSETLTSYGRGPSPAGCAPEAALAAYPSHSQAKEDDHDRHVGGLPAGPAFVVDSPAAKCEEEAPLVNADEGSDMALSKSTGKLRLTSASLQVLRQALSAWKSQQRRTAGTVWSAEQKKWVQPGTDLRTSVQEQHLIEYFYETRVAGAERLVGFMVMFHRMVSEAARLPYLGGFEMGRSESRLRVASTPAPVPMRV